MRKIIKRILKIMTGTILSILLSWGHMAQAQNFANVLQPEDSTANVGQAENVSAENFHQHSTDAAAPGEDAAVPSELSPDMLNALAPVDDSKYTLGVNDVIEVKVARHPEVSNQYLINSEGKIQYEFVGDVIVAGLTKKDAKDLITERLSTYIVKPEVTVTIVGYNSKVVYVIGEVGRPGKIFMRGDTITVREALLEAGLPLLTASMRRCPLITPADDGKAELKYVDVFKLVYEGDLRENLIMKPGETLYVPATVLAKAMRVIQPVAQPVSAAGSTIRRVNTGGF